MRLEAAPKFKSTRRVALVLGDLASGELICERLHEEGFETRLKTPPRFNSSVEQLKKLLRDFAEGEKGASLWLHPGVSPIAERSEWAILGRDLGITLIAPPARSVSLFNNRLTLLGEGEKIGISNLLLTSDPLHSVREIEKLIRTGKFKFPFVLKSVRGGSGFGVKVIHQAEDLGKSLQLWLEQIRRNQGEVIILAERYLEGARRIVQPFARFSDGKMELFPPIDASLTSRLRKIVEFCPAQQDESELKFVHEWTRSLAQHSGYVGVGSLEFLVDGGTRTYLIEGVPRLNTSFALWENTAGTSAVAWQLAAMSSPGHADVPARKERSDWKFGLALRIYAEDPILQLPQPGKVIEVGEKRTWDFPGSSARLNLVIQEGVDVLPEGQGVLGHLLVGAEDRKRAITVARGVLDEVWIAGSLQTNERFLHELLTHPWVQEGMFHASFVDEEFIPSVRPDPALLKIFLRMAQQLAEGTVGPSSSKWAVGDQWIKTPSEQGFTWVAEPGFFQADDRRGITGVIQAENGEILRVFCYPLASDRWLARVGNWFLQVRRVPARATQPVSQTQKLTALVSGRVHSLLFREGASVPAHESALLVESLNMLISHALPVDVRVVRWLVSAEDQVQAGQVLAEFERAAQVR